jgi:hypothetical protein
MEASKAVKAPPYRGIQKFPAGHLLQRAMQFTDAFSAWRADQETELAAQRQHGLVLAQHRRHQALCPALALHAQQQLTQLMALLVGAHDEAELGIAVVGIGSGTEVVGDTAVYSQWRPGP